jgi:hypothetical protein
MKTKKGFEKKWGREGATLNFYISYPAVLICDTRYLGIE